MPILDGLLNYVFIFEFDVLMGYGLTGLVVAFVMAGSPRAQKIWMGVGVALHLAHLSLMQAPLLLMNLLDPAAERAVRIMERHADDPERARAALAELGGNHLAEYDSIPAADVALDTAVEGTGSYWAQVTGRVENFWWGRGEIPVMFTMGLGLFLVGAHLYRAGIFRPEGARLRRWVMGLGFGVGVPLDVLARLVFPDVGAGFARYGTSTIVAFGVLAAVAAFYANGRTPGWLGRPLSHVGRMALTCYLAQNLLASILFYDWGLGLANRTTHLNATAVTLAGYVLIAAILVAFSALWLRRFPRGPVEWAWHASYEWIAARTEPGRVRRARRRAERRAQRIAAVDPRVRAR